jgi:hypothetical protein
MTLKHDQGMLFAASDKNQCWEHRALLEQLGKIHEILAAQAENIDTSQGVPHSIYRQARTA